MSTIGGITGALFGIGSALVIEHFSQYSVVIEPQAIILALSFSMGVGVFFGFYQVKKPKALQ
jgi:putative ABC transport system permease protein